MTGANIVTAEGKIKQNSGLINSGISKNSENCSLSRYIQKNLITYNVITFLYISYSISIPPIHPKRRSTKNLPPRPSAPKSKAKINAPANCTSLSNAPQRPSARQLISDKIKKCKLSAANKSAAQSHTARQLINDKIKACKLAANKSAAPKKSARRLINDKINSCQLAANKSAVTEACGTDLNQKL